MKEIKFRAWETLEKRVIAPVVDKINPLYILSQSMFGQDDRFIFMQCINQKDAVGNDVFEGDIIQSPLHGLMVVYWDVATARYAPFVEEGFFDKY